MNNKPEYATDYVVFDKHNHFVTRGSVKDFIPLPIPAQIKSTFQIIFEKPFYSIGGFATPLWSIQLEEICSFEDEIHVLMDDYMKRGVAVKIIRQHFEGQSFRVVFANNTGKFIACTNLCCGQFYYMARREPAVYDGLCLDCHMANGADTAKLLSLWPLLIDCAIGLGDITKREGDVLVRQIVYGMNLEEIADDLGVGKRNIYKIIQEFNDKWINFQNKIEKTSKEVRKRQRTYRGLAISIALKIRERQSECAQSPMGWSQDLTLEEFLETYRKENSQNNNPLIF